MKVRVERNELAGAVAWLNGLRGKRAYQPALAGIRVEAVDGFLRMQATDLETSGEVEIAAAIDEPGAVLPSAGILHAVTSRLPDAPVSLSGDSDGLEVVGGRVRARVPMLRVEDFPRLPDVTGVADVTLPSTVVESIHRRIASAATGDPARPILTAVYLSVDDGQLLAAATDSYQLHRLDTALEGTGKAAVNVPAGVFGPLAKLGHPLHVAFSEDRVEFAGEDRRLVTTLVAGVFPNPEQFFATTVTSTLQVSLDELTVALKRCAALVGNVDNVPMDLRASDGFLEVAVAHQVAGEIADAVPVDGELEQMKVHPGRLLTAVEAIGSDRIDLGVIDPFKPIFVSDPNGGAVRAVVMPMR